jgi:hypothetical protein
MKSNYYDSRESWLRAATNELRPYFAGCGYPLPDKIRFAIGFPSTGRKGNRVGECWHSSTSDDEHFEIFIRADFAEPGKVLGVLVHVVVPVEAKHGKLYRAAALKIGLQGKMVHALPGILLQSALTISPPLLGLYRMPGSISNVGPITGGLPTERRTRKPAITRPNARPRAAPMSSGSPLPMSALSARHIAPNTAR